MIRDSWQQRLQSHIFFASPIFGNLADRIGNKRIILFGLAGFIFSNIIYLFADNIQFLYLARAIEGVFSAAIFPPAIALIMEISPKENRAKYIGNCAEILN